MRINYFIKLIKMEDLLQSQIMDSCKLAMPEGLKELMSDISREVLRAQPKNIIKFITDYLSCLLVTRENLTVAHRVYNNICDQIHPERLEDELRKLNIYSDDIGTIKQLVEKYLEIASAGNPVNEGMLVSKVLHRTSIVEEQIPAIQVAIRKAFRQHQQQDIDIDKHTSIQNFSDDVARAVDYTLDLYQKTEPSNLKYHQAAATIQAAYRAYGVRRQKATIEKVNWSYAPAIIARAESIDTDELDRATRFLSNDIEKFVEFYHQPDNDSLLSTTSSVNVLLPNEQEIEKDYIDYDVPEEIVVSEDDETECEHEEDIKDEMSNEDNIDDLERDTNVKFDRISEIIAPDIKVLEETLDDETDATY